jgi:hypothetical protein
MVIGVSATTEAVRGPPSSREISPKKSPGYTRFTTRPFWLTTFA